MYIENAVDIFHSVKLNVLCVFIQNGTLVLKEKIEVTYEKDLAVIGQFSFADLGKFEKQILCIC